MTENVPPFGTDLCAIEDLHDGKGRAFSWGVGKRAFGVIVLRRGDAVRGFINRCPHFNIPLDHNMTVTTFGDFVLCSHHYAAFRFNDGYCMEGPCEGASLEPMPLAIENGRVVIAGDVPSVRER